MLPYIFSEKIKGILSQKNLDFKPLNSDGRCTAAVHYPYKVNESRSLYVAIVRYNPGGTMSAYHHPSYKLIYMLDGEVETEQDVFKKNDLIIMPPDNFHTAAKVQKDAWLSLFGIFQLNNMNGITNQFKFF